MPGHALLYGPVPSRRLGYSLGVDILPFKTCSMDCVYCQLGASARTFVRRREFVPADEVLAQVRAELESGKRIDAITFSGSGEPTLHSGIRKIIRGIKGMTAVPVVVLTNSSTLAGAAGRRAIAEADIVVPSLDAATEPIFARINRPHPGLTAAGIIAGLAEFRKSFRGEIWLEIMLVKGINDGAGHLRALKKAVRLIRPDRVQLNTVVRPPAERTARPLSAAEMERIRSFFGGKAETLVRADKTRPERGGNDPRTKPGAPAAAIVRVNKTRPEYGGNDPQARLGAPAAVIAAILGMAGRRPVTAADLSRSLGTPAADVIALAARLEKRGLLRSVRHRNRTFFEAV